MSEMNEAELLDRLAEETKKLSSKCQELEKENLSQLRRIERINWIQTSAEIGFTLIIGFCLGWWIMTPGAYESGTRKWKAQYCAATTKTIEQYQKCL